MNQQRRWESSTGKPTVLDYETNSIETTVEPLSDAFHWVVEDRTAAYRDHLQEFLT